jgi:hypothetical protein
MLEETFQRIHDWPIAAWIRSNGLAFPTLESVHVLAIAFVVGTIVVVDLRLLGVASVERLVTEILQEVLPFTWVAFAVAVVTGFLMFTSNAVGYAHNAPFQFKLMMMVLAGTNMLCFHLITLRGVNAWDSFALTSPGARFAGAFSLFCWMCVVAFGRWIGFTIGY